MNIKAVQNNIVRSHISTTKMGGHLFIGCSKNIFGPGVSKKKK
ncbi:MAG: hypothetical protein WC949_00130 [Candidatus Paceibacterota bacterium]